MGALERHAALAEACRRDILEAAGRTASSARRAAYEGDGAGGAEDGPLGAYLDAVRLLSAEIGDTAVDKVRAAGYPEDAIFELTVAAAAGEAFRRLAAGLKAMGEGGG